MGKFFNTMTKYFLIIKTILFVILLFTVERPNFYQISNESALK